MAVNNKNTDIQKNITHKEIPLPESLVKKLSFNQKSIIEALATKPEGILSRALSHKTGISNKSDTLKFSVRERLAKYGLEIHTERVLEKRQWLWKLRPIQSSEAIR